MLNVINGKLNARYRFILTEQSDKHVKLPNEFGGSLQKELFGW